MPSTSTRLALTVVTALFMAGGAAAQPRTEEIRIALSWLRNGQYAALMVADAKGFFAAEGLKVAIVDGGPGKNPVPLVGVGQAQFGVVSAAQVVAARVAPNPVDVVAIGALVQDLPYAFVTLARPGDPDPKPKDLEGKRVGIQADGEIYLKALAQRNQVDLGKVKVETVLATPEPLLIGRVDFFGAMLHNQTYQIEQETARADASPLLKGKVWKALRFSTYGVPSYGDVLFTSGRMLREQPDTVRRFMRAVAQGLKFTLENPSDAVRLVDAYPQQIERADKLAWRLKVQAPMNVGPDTRAHGLLWMNASTWERAMAFYRQFGQIPRTLPAAEVMTNAFNPGVNVGSPVGPPGGSDVGPDVGPKSSPKTGPGADPKAEPKVGLKTGPPIGSKTDSKTDSEAAPKAGPQVGA